jgi:tetratricopeptide (TPR) repeat protein
MRKVAAVLVIIVFLTGCKTSFKSNFRNFSGYYNTFYNAKKSYNLGYDKSESQTRNYNTLLPIRIYRTPLGAGAGDFQNAIDKGADILRKFDDTKWVDDALLIIGKSYFFRREYFSAEQKFEELYISTENSELKQRAVFWKGRVLLELEAYNQGVQYLTDELAVFEDEWKDDLNHQINVVLAEHYIEREDFVNALDLLNESVDHLPGKPEKERGYFLIGQLNERLGYAQEAFEAYDRVEKYYTDYDIQFEALKKKAEVARTLGDPDEAYNVFSKMVRDDKNTEFVAELNYELGRTEQERGNYDRAEEIYKSILRDRNSQPGAVTKALSYNSLAELNRYQFDDFEQAAAYYDSSAKVNAPLRELPEDFNAAENAQSFGEYANLKEEIHMKDSLIWLGTLPEAEFDSVLKELENQKREELARIQREREQQRNTLVNVNASNENQAQQNIEKNGFLNYKNPVLLADASQQFRALWNNRPLVDNWRLSQLLVVEVQENEISDENNSDQLAGAGDDVFVNIDLSQVPFTVSEQDSMREEVSFLHYELANLFFLSLNLPDSAEIYFNKVLDEQPNSEVVPVTLYSLSELHSIEGQPDEAVKRAQELVDRFPNTVYADRVIEKYGLETPQITGEEEQSPREEYLWILNDPFMADSIRLDALINFEEKYRPEELARKALDESVTTYLRIGMETEGFRESFQQWEDAQSNWELKKDEFTSLQDSARSALTDTLLTTSDSLYYTSILDSSLTEPDFRELFPYRGENWDSTRSVIDLYLVHYSNSPGAKRISTLKQELTPPSEPQPEEEPLEDEPLASEDTNYLFCDEIDQELFIRGGKEAFMQTVEIPQGIRDRFISFLFFVNPRGIIDEFKLSSNTVNQTLIDNFVSAIDQNVSFDPVLVEGEAVSVQCEITFRLSNQ